MLFRSVIQIIEKAKKFVNPELVFTHFPDDLNVDHQIVANATMTAFRTKAKENCKKILAFEVPSSTEWYFPSEFSPNIFVDISKEIKSKFLAIKKYKNEILEFPHPRSIDALEAIAKRWGSVSGFMYAEAFSLVRKLD